MKLGKPVIIIGGGGYARLLIDVLLEQDVEILGFTEKVLEVAKTMSGEYEVPFLGDDAAVLEYAPNTVELVNGIGSAASTRLRQTIYETFREQGYHFRQVIHPFSYVSRRAVLGEGVHVLGGAVINIGARIGRNTIVNNRTAVSHDCVIGDHVHVAPGCTLSGDVSVGDSSHIGSGTTIIQGISVGSRALVGAGAVVIRDVRDDAFVCGVPAKEKIRACN